MRRGGHNALSWSYSTASALALAMSPGFLSLDAAFDPNPFPPGHRISAELTPLCQKISDEEIAELDKKYRGV